MNGLTQAQRQYDRAEPGDGNGRPTMRFTREKAMPAGPVIVSSKWIELPKSGEKKGEK